MSAQLGSVEWLAARTATLAGGPAYHGPGATIDVVVSGGPDGPIAYHVVLAEGEAPSFRAGAAPDGADATLELTWSDAAAQERGEADPAVSYMRGETKTKGATRPVYELLRLLAR